MRSLKDMRPAARWPPASAGWRNWDRRQRCQPAQFERPAHLEELAAVLDRAHRRGQGVRVAGSGHSFTALVPTEGTLISLEQMNRVLDVDSASGLVTVEAGITLGQLNRVLDACGLAFENLGDIDSQTIAGATATGTHGTGRLLRNLSSQIHSLELMRADGTAVTLHADNDPDAWLAARVSLGALGVVTKVTLRTVPAFRLLGVERPMPLDEALERLDELSAEHDHVDLYWFPYARDAFVRLGDRTELPVTPRSAARRYFDEILLVNHALHGISMLGRRFPGWIPRLNRLETRLAGSSERVDRSHRIFVSPRLVRFTEMEYAIPRERGGAAIRALRARIASARLPINFPVEVRFVAGDDALLSPAHGRDTCYIAVHVFDGMEFEPYFAMAEEIMDGFGGRPHWGKRHNQTASTLRERYPEWDRFQSVRARFDPAGVFTNAEVERVLGPVL
jgi:L-gulonolactone oxidase